MKSLHIHIAGAGIAGLTLAANLEKKGHFVELFEKRAKFSPEGAGILIAANALKLLDLIELGNPLRECGHTIQALEIRDETEKVIRSAVTPETISIHRDDLHRVLRGALESNIHMDMSTLPGNGADLCVGADGINSHLRQTLDTEVEVKEAGQICWRTVIPHQAPQATQTSHGGSIGIEYWSKNRRAGIIPLGENSTYLYFVVAEPALFDQSFTNDTFQQLFQGMSPNVDDVITHIDMTQLRCDKLKQVKSHHWYRDRAVLIGDAAHAMTPNMGQGACQAIEDAFVLSHLLSTTDSIDVALKSFVERRKPRVEKIQKQSWIIGKMAHTKYTWCEPLRNTILRWTPKSVDDRAMKELMAGPKLD